MLDKDLIDDYEDKKRLESAKNLEDSKLVVSLLKESFVLKKAFKLFSFSVVMIVLFVLIKTI